MDTLSSPQFDNQALDPLIELIGFRLSTATVLFHSAIADRLGVSATDVKCYSILRQTGSITAGELAEQVSLTTGAITGVLDRLEKAGLVRRVPDLKDRRRIMVELVHDPERERAMYQLYMPLGQAITALVANYSNAERAIITDFITQATQVLEAETRKLRSGISAE